MKKYLLLFAFSAVGLTSCDDEDTQNYELDMLKGSWKTAKVEIISGADKKTVISTDIPSGCSEKNLTEFRTDYLTSYTSFFPQGNDCGEFKTEGKFSYDAETKRLGITYDGDSERTYKIEILNPTELKLKQTYDNIDYNGDMIIDQIYISYKR